MATSDIFNLTDTWNAGATTFSAIKMNVTDTASASGSMLMDLQVGGAAKFFVRKDGYTAISSSFDASGYIAASNLIQTAANFNLVSNTGLVQFGASNDTILGRNAAASLRLGAADAAAPVAQTLGVQSVVAGTTNTAGVNFTIKGSAGTGTGAGGSIIFQVAPAGGSGTAQNAFSDAFTITSTRMFQFRGGASSTLSFAGEAIYAMNTAATQNRAMLSEYGIRAASDVPIGFSNSTTNVGTQDVFLYRDAANTLALKNGANAQELRVYKNTTGTVYKAILGDNNLIKISGEAFTNGAGASTGTLTNAPAVGNPTKWIPIDDNGTTRYIPAW